MKVMGIDPGIGRVGWGIVTEDIKTGDLKSLGYGLIETKVGEKEERRLQQIYDQVCGIIKKEKPDLVAVEKLFFFKNHKTAFTVSQARGVIILAIADCQKKICHYTPLQVKQAVTGYGRATKTQVQEMVKVILKLKEIPKPDDVADALAIAICAANFKEIN